MNKKNNNVNKTNFIIKEDLEKKFNKNSKNRKDKEFYKNIFINKMIYKCIYPENIEEGLKKFIS
jgi:hypothetical protein